MRRMKRTGIVVAVLAAVAILAAVSRVPGAVSQIRTGVSYRDAAVPGPDHCVEESLGGGPGVGQDLRASFVVWLKGRLPAHAVYQVAPYAGPPDPWCLTTLLLPALPAGPGGTPAWTVTFGRVPPSIAAQMRRRDGSVQVYAPGFVLARGQPR
jgi:hypothetical protein